MKKRFIKRNADLVVDILERQNFNRCSCEFLKEVSKLSFLELYVAIGWLSQEGKIIFDEDAGVVQLQNSNYLNIFLAFYL